MNSSRALHDLMLREQDGLERLGSLLDAEHAALAARDTAALEQLTAGKLALLEELEQLGKARQELLTQAGLSADRVGFETLLERFPGTVGHDLATRWHAVQEQLRRCQEQNRINGMVLDASQRATQQALAILLGQTRDADTYDAQGTVRGGSASRGFVKA